MNKFKEMLKDNSAFKVWEKLDNGCYIGTMGYSENNAKILEKLLMSFAEQYGEIIDINAAKEELMLYQKEGILFIYLDQNLNAISMNGCIYDYDNATVDFKSVNNKNLKSLYFYGLSTLKEHRGKGACRTLIDYSIKFAKENKFDYVYARTDLVNSNSEWLMQQNGMEICVVNDYIIAEKVVVTDEVSDYRLHMWLPLNDDVYLEAKEGAEYAYNDEIRDVIMPAKTLTKKYKLNQ